MWYTVCHLYHGLFILKASYDWTAAVPCVLVLLKCRLKTSLESCRNLFAGFHVDTFRRWSWERPKQPAGFLCPRAFSHVYMHAADALGKYTLWIQTVNLQLSRGDREMWLKQKREEADQGSVLSSFSSSALWLSVLYFCPCDMPNSPKAWCFCRPLLVTQMPHWNPLPPPSSDRRPDFSSWAQSVTVFCFIISQRDVVPWSGLKICFFTFLFFLKNQ